MSRNYLKLFTCITILVYPCIAFADTVDIVWFIARVGDKKNIPYTLFLVFVLAAANYLLNLIIIGVPVLRKGVVPKSKIFLSLIPLTVMGQVVDRLGIIIGVAFLPVLKIFGLPSEGLGPAISHTIYVNFISSGILFGFLVFYFLKKIWGLSGKDSRPIAIVSAIIANPALSMALWYYPW
jgi:hypothetical protein